MPPPFWAKPKVVALVILAYLASHFALRMAMWPTLGIDDAEQALFAQEFSWSYRFRAPPLFTWLLLALGRVIGVEIVAIGLIRYALLAATFGVVYLTARRLIADPRLAALSVYSFAAIYIFAYYSHHDLTHTTALSAMLAAAWYVFVRLAAAPAPGWYLGLGAAFGLGLLAKWNFAMFAAALPLACLLHPRFRHLVLTWKIVPAALVTALVVLPTIIAAIEAGPAPGDDLRSVVGDEAGFSFRQMAEGTLQLLKAAVVYPQPLLVLVVLVLGLPLWRGLRARDPDPPAGADRLDAALIGLTMATSLALHWALVPLLGASEFSERLMQPALFILPLWLFMLIERGRPSARAVNLFALILALLALGTFAARAAIYLRGADHCGSCRAMAPFHALAEDLQAAGFSGRGTILSEGLHIGGNMRVLFPQARIVDADFPLAEWPAPQGEAQCLLLWQERDDPAATRRSSEQLQTYLAQALDGDSAAPHRAGTASARMFRSAKREYRLGFRLYDGPNGDCR